MAQPMQMYSGVDSVRGAQELNKAIQGRRDAWPYPHIYAPPSADDVHVLGAVETPALGVEVLVCSYRVSSGKRFFLRGVLLSVTGASTFVPGSAIWTVDRNKPVGVPNVQGAVEHGLVNVPFPLGSPERGQWKLWRAREFEPLDLVQIKATNLALAVGSPFFFECGIFGYEVPVLEVLPAK